MRIPKPCVQYFSKQENEKKNWQKNHVCGCKAITVKCNKISGTLDRLEQAQSFKNNLYDCLISNSCQICLQVSLYVCVYSVN